ncbi:MAG: uncharacterized membrane protein YkvA (DUF1232 family) [Myxococcota bacterium]|jgi:uncharacterized membrane protein YkvA (DUF1232 family)
MTTADASIKVSFELNKKDIKYFRERLKSTRSKRDEKDDEIVIQAAAASIKDAIAADSPEFVCVRLDTLNQLIEMVRDTQWRLEGRDRVRVLDALAYFADPEDLIPDRIPGIGYIDDAIMIELVARELKHEIKSYEDFCDFRKQKAMKADDDKISARRESLQRRMRRRRRSDSDRLRSSGGRSSLKLW